MAKEAVSRIKKYLQTRHAPGVTEAKDKNGKTVVKQSPYWYIDYKTADGTRKRIRGFKDKIATAQLAANLEREAELAQAGIIDRYKKHRKTALVKHLEDFKVSLINKGTTEKHACLVYNRAKAVIDNCRFVYISDVSASKVQRYLAERRRDGLSIRSSNFYLQATKQLLNWMIANSRTSENPLAYLKGQNPKKDIRHERRALTLDEANKLLTATLHGPKHHNMTGKERYLLFVMAIYTGYRAGELSSMKWHSLDLTEGSPSATVFAGYAKNGKETTLPLQREVANLFRQYFVAGNFSQNDKVFPKFNKGKGAAMLKRDLEAVGIPYQDHAWRYADFHGLRHTFTSVLDKAELTLKERQTLLRHSTITLTMDVYTHIGLFDERHGVDKMPVLPTISDNKEHGSASAALKTGTDDTPVDRGGTVYKPVYKKLAKNACSGFDKLSSIDIEEGKKQELVGSDKSFRATVLGNESNQLSTPDTGETKRRRPDSNRRITVLQTVALDHLATPPTLLL